jgi:hypothetical protein
VQVGAQHFECDTAGTQGALRVFFRPRAVQVRGVNGATPTRRRAHREVEFLGAYSRVTFRLPASTRRSMPTFPTTTWPGSTPSQATRCASRCRRTGCACFPPHEPRSGDVAFTAARAAPARRLLVHWTDRVGNVVLLAAASRSRCSCWHPGGDPRQERREPRRGFRRAGEFRELLPHAGAAHLDLEQRLGVRAGDGDHHAARVHLRLRAHAQRHAVQDAAAQRGAVPILAPSLLAAISFIFWFGNQGLLKPLMGNGQIYGAPGIVISMIFATFPHALMILVTALSLTDARLYEAADSLGTSAWRKFFTITVPARNTASSARRWWCSPMRCPTSASRR